MHNITYSKQGVYEGMGLQLDQIKIKPDHHTDIDGREIFTQCKCVDVVSSWERGGGLKSYQHGHRDHT